MRVLVAGDWHSELHERVVSDALTSLGHDVQEFKWCQYFNESFGLWGRLHHFTKRAENKYIFGPTINRINNDLIARNKISIK